MIDGILQVEDAVLQGVADVVLRVAGRGHLLVHRSLLQLLVLEHTVNVTLLNKQRLSQDNYVTHMKDL
jgi:hypothetical protein